MKRVLLVGTAVLLAAALCSCARLVHGFKDRVGHTIKDAVNSAEEAVDSAQNAVSSALESMADVQTGVSDPGDIGTQSEKPVWPDSEAAKQVPQPPFEDGEVKMTGPNQLTGYYTGLAVDEAREYADALRHAGFTMEETSSDFSFVYMFQAKNDKGWMAMLTYATADGSAVLLVQKADS